MSSVDVWAVLVSVVAMFALSSVYYAVVSVPRDAQGGNVPEENLALWKVPLELWR